MRWNKLLGITSLKILCNTFFAQNIEFSLCDMLTSFYYNYAVQCVRWRWHWCDGLEVCFSVLWLKHLCPLNRVPALHTQQNGTMLAHICLLKQPNKIHICVTTSRRIISLWKCIVLLSHLCQTLIQAQTGDKTRTFSVNLKQRISKVATITLQIHID